MNSRPVPLGDPKVDPTWILNDPKLDPKSSSTRSVANHFGETQSAFY